MSDPRLHRYSRQILFERIGPEGQAKLRQGRALLVGCGALGSVLANHLVRAGIGFLRICDRDFLEIDNLQRQALYDEDDLAANLPKAAAAVRKLARINREVTLEAVVDDVNPANIERLAEGVDVLLDGTDNFDTRYLINDLAVQSGRPWVYGAVVGSTGLVMTIVPGDTPCLRCVFDEPPPPELSPTCDTAGVLGPAVDLVASLQAIEAIKLLAGRRAEINRHLLNIDAWSGSIRAVKVAQARADRSCPCCTDRVFAYLTGEAASQVTTLCGRDAVQVRPAVSRSVALEVLAGRLAAAGAVDVSSNVYLMRARIEDCEVTVFADGRTIVKGTADPARAKSICARYLGA